MNMRILRTLPREKAFYFFTSIGNYTGENAASLKEFMEKIKEVNVKSLEFHLYRRDFRKWIAETLEDRDLTVEIENLQDKNCTGSALRERLHAIISRRYEELKLQLDRIYI
jgi:MoaA/NifB/PqqE/SkfB family radical SAM enzyme